MATLPLEKGSRKRPLRQEVVTLEKDIPHSHYQSTHLAVCHRPLEVSELSVWIDLLPGQELYIGLEFQCKFLPLLISPHVTIGKFAFVKRVKISKLYDVRSITLAPFGGGFNWEIEAATAGSSGQWLSKLDLRDCGHPLSMCPGIACKRLLQQKPF